MRKVITVSREFGSGGREVGRTLAEALNIPYYDNEILTQIVERTNLAKDYVQRVLERDTYFPFPVRTARSFAPARDVMSEQYNAIFLEQQSVIFDMAKQSDCVIVGRCADYILQDLNPLRIFVYADMKHKIERCREREEGGEHLTEKELQNMISGITKKRSKYYHFYTGQEWGDKSHYDLCINMTNITTEDAVRAIISLVNKV